MSKEALDQFIDDCRAELSAVIFALESKRSGDLGTLSALKDRVANLKSTIQQLEAHKASKHGPKQRAGRKGH